jgi:hypothetical protein
MPACDLTKSPDTAPCACLQREKLIGGRVATAAKSSDISRNNASIRTDRPFPGSE